MGPVPAQVLRSIPLERPTKTQSRDTQKPPKKKHPKTTFFTTPSTLNTAEAPQHHQARERTGIAEADGQREDARANPLQTANFRVFFFDAPFPSAREGLKGLGLGFRCKVVVRGLE